MIRLFPRRRAAAPAVRPPVPTPADLAQADALRRFEAAVAPAMTGPAPVVGLPIVPVRGSYKVTYKLRGHSLEPISAVEVDAVELAALITTDLRAVLGTSDVTVTVDLGKKCGLIRAHGMNVGTFDLAKVGGAR